MFELAPSFPIRRGPTRPPAIPELKLPQSRPRILGLAVSLLAHGSVLVLLTFHGDRIWRQMLGPGADTSGSARGGGGGARERVAYIILPPIPRTVPPPRVEVPPPVPPPHVVHTPVPEPVTPTAAPMPVDTVAVADAVRDGADSAGGNSGVGAGRAAGEGEGPAAGGGVGTGGVGTGGGGGGVLRPPEPRDMAFPFDTPPKELRGVSLSVTFWVRVDGRVERYEVEPAIKDREYAKKFDEVMRAFRFTPARTPDGRLVAGTTRISFTLPGKSSS